MLWFVLAGALLGLVGLIIWVRLPAFLSLLIVALLTGLAAGMAPLKVVQALQNGIGSTLGSLALVLTLGVILGNILSETGAIQIISNRLLERFGAARVQWALALTAFVIGIALFYNAGFVILAPFVFSLAGKTGRPVLPLALAMAAPLSVTHGFLPPHPGATAVATVFGADPGQTLLLGLYIALPTVVLAGVLFPSFLGNIHTNIPESLRPSLGLVTHGPGGLLSITLALLPVLLMALSAISPLFTEKDSHLNQLFSFLGDPGIALLIAVLLSALLLTRHAFNPRQGLPGFQTVMEKSVQAVSTAAMLLLVIAAGGAFKQVLVDSGLSRTVTDLAAHLNWSPLIMGWGVATLLRIAVGSATVAGMTAAGIVQPFIQQNECISPELMTLAVGAGSLMCSHVNDTGFWMFKEWFGLSLGETFRSWTVMETLVGLCGLAGVLLLDIWI